MSGHPGSRWQWIGWSEDEAKSELPEHVPATGSVVPTGYVYALAVSPDGRLCRELPSGW